MNNLNINSKYTKINFKDKEKNPSFKGINHLNCIHLSQTDPNLFKIETFENQHSLIKPYVDKLKKIIDKGFQFYEKATNSDDSLSMRKAKHYYKLARETAVKLKAKLNQENSNPELIAHINNLEQGCAESQFSCLKCLFKKDISVEALKQSETFYKQYHKALSETKTLQRFTEKFKDGVNLSINQYFDENGLPVAKKTVEAAYKTLVVDLKNDAPLQKAVLDFGEKLDKTSAKSDLEKLNLLMTYIDDTFPETVKNFLNHKTGIETDYYAFQRNHQPHRAIKIGEILTGSLDGIKPSEGVCLEQSIICKTIAENNGMNMALVQNRKHCWNEFISDNSGKTYLFDPRQRTVADLTERKIYKYDTESKQLESFGITNVIETFKNYINEGTIESVKCKNGLTYLPQYEIYADLNKSILYEKDLSSKTVKKINNIEEWVFQLKTSNSYIQIDGQNNAYNLKK